MFNCTQIGVIHSCFREKFGIPRQAGLAPAATAKLELLSPYNAPEALRGLEGFSHIWLLFVFHAIPAGQWQPTVRPPRLGGKQRLGVFATRSPFRPNPLGLSAVGLQGIDAAHGVLHLSGVDLLDGTPILDIKPYLPYADHIVDAVGGFAAHAPHHPLQVTFSKAAEDFCAAWTTGDLRELITQIIRQDPRPAYAHRQAAMQTYAIKLYDFDVHWQTCGDIATVTAITQCAP